MKRLIPHLKLCAVATAIASLSACGGGDSVTDECAATNLASAQTTTPTAIATTSPTPAPAPQPSYSSDDDDDDSDGDDDDGDDDDTKNKAAACPAPATSTASAPAPAPTSDTGTTAPAPAPSPAPTPDPAPAPAPAPASSSASVGKSLYLSSCASCHGSDPTKNQSKILKGTSASTTLSAIANNKGGMGFLSGSIGSKEAEDIAAYLSNP